ncbi:phosphocholine cytidylyltransferase family protein, partial [Mesorhizobium sp. M00.F.Ca.ET.186.01.1.1]
LWWENVLYSFLGERDVHVAQIPPGLFWAEVDTWEDYKRILHFTNHLAHM